jgi:putative transcriptional regulator, araC family
MIFSLCIFGGITLLAHPQRSKPKFILGSSMLFWSILICIRLIINPLLDDTKTLFQPIILITGSFVMATTTCYIIEILRPGYLTFKRFCIFISPAITSAFLGCFYAYRKGGSTCYDFWDLFTLSNPDIVFHIILLASNLFYMILPAHLTFRYNKEYSKYLKENVSNPDDYDLLWLKRTMIVFSAMYVSYFILLLTRDSLLYVINKGFILALWYYLFYKALFLKEIQWKISFARGWNILEEEGNVIKDENNFTPKNNYLQEIEQWFKTEKPFLQGDLRLSDLQRKFPISRTYLSQLFNKELGISFSDYVNQLRIEESKRILESEPQAEIIDVAERSGFNSASSFRRAFTKFTNQSPSEFKKKTARLVSNK